jgi:hypothetical protein
LPPDDEYLGAAADTDTAAGRITSASSLPEQHPIECSSTKTTNCKTRVEQLKWDARLWKWDHRA